MPRVAIFGGGVAGMTAAHYLIQKGFEVDVYERRAECGGKARSFGAPNPAFRAAGQTLLPSEHGFRFVHGFYWHLPDTMAEIPLPGSGNVTRNLIAATQAQLARANNQSEIMVPFGVPQNLQQLQRVTQYLLDYSGKVGVPSNERWFFIAKLVMLATSSQGRLFGEFELESWWHFSDADNKGPEYRKYLADNMTRAMVAAKARKMSARTGGCIALQLIYDLSRPGPHFMGKQFVRVLNAPTREAWLDPWYDFLVGEGVNFRFDAEATHVECAGQQVQHVEVTTPNGPQVVQADYYLIAVPLDRMKGLLDVSPTITVGDPGLDSIHLLEDSWMTGVMFYLLQDVPVLHGHTICVDSDWSLTLISQPQFWPHTQLDQMGDGQVNGLLSVDVSDWETDSQVLGKPAKECTEQEVVTEVWRQLKEHLNNHPLVELLTDANLYGASVDTAIGFNPPNNTNDEPLLINTVGSWNNRPYATTRISNLFLAADYVRTYTDLATMEGANEAARLAVNGILDRSGSAEDRLEVRQPWQPGFLETARKLDGVLWSMGLPHVLDGVQLEMPADFPARPDLALGRLQRQASRPPPGVDMPPGWEDRPTPVRPGRQPDPEPLNPILRRPGDPPRPDWVRTPRRPPPR